MWLRIWLRAPSRSQLRSHINQEETMVVVIGIIVAYALIVWLGDVVGRFARRNGLIQDIVQDRRAHQALLNRTYRPRTAKTI